MDADAAAANGNSATTDDMMASIMEITGAGREEAGHLLAACSNNLEAAVALFFEQGPPNLSRAPAASASGVPELAIDDDEDDDDDSDVVGDADDVRAPIAPRRDRMVRPEEDHFYRESSPTNNRRLARAAPRVKVCPLRDFAREGEIMEQQLRAAASLEQSTSTSNDILVAASGSRDSSLSSMRRRARIAAAHLHSKSRGHGGMSALFRPPLELMFIGTFKMACTRATSIKRWLLVNVQNQNFNSQVLNRDVWSNKDVRKLIQRQFVLYQVDADTPDGRRFIAFYHCKKQPYLSIIDPRTGEEVWNSDEPNSCNVLNNLREFLLKHKDFALEMEEATASSRDTNIIIDDDDEEEEEGACSSTAALPAKRSKVVELSEEEQLALAIRNSLRENGDSQESQQTNGDDENSKSSTSSSTTSSSNIAISSNATSSGLEDFKFEESSQIAVEKIDYKAHLGSNKDETTMLKLRLLNAEGLDEIVQLRWPSDTKFKALRYYIAMHYKHIPQSGYKLICAFPRKSLEAEHDEQTLKDLSLHPSANVHLTLED